MTREWKKGLIKTFLQKYPNCFSLTQYAGVCNDWQCDELNQLGISVKGRENLYHP